MKPIFKKVLYDKESDVLYLTFDKSKPCTSIEAGDGVLIRKTLDGKLNGITIIDFHKRVNEKQTKNSEA